MTLTSGQAATGKDFGNYQPASLILHVTNVNDSGAGSLRQAVVDANAVQGVAHTISFEIPGTGAHAIELATALPALVDPVIAALGSDCRMQVR